MVIRGACRTVAWASAYADSVLINRNSGTLPRRRLQNRAVGDPARGTYGKHDNKSQSQELATLAVHHVRHCRIYFFDALDSFILSSTFIDSSSADSLS